MKNTNKSIKRAFTLIELLIVIAIIGILFIVLVSRVDFATDKAKATGVQTDFRSFQVALETVSKENAGFASLGWNTGDDNGDRKRNSYDEGDIGTGVGTPGYHNGKVDSGEIWTGHKVYGETWGSVYTLVNPANNTDTSAFEALEAAINANLDPKLHITITPELSGTALTGNAVVSMANGAQDPWKKEYHGVYITNAVADNGADRGAFVLYSDGANGKWGSAHKINDGIVNVWVPNNNIAGKDDYAISVFYTYANGYGEVAIVTAGFSNNQQFLGEIPADELDIVLPEAGNENVFDESQLIEFTIGTFEANTSFTPGQYTTVEYEVTKIREKKPVASSQTISFNDYPDTVNVETLNPFLSTYESTYMVYSCYKAGSNSNGYIDVHCNQRTINNPADDTLENAIYLAACVQKSVSDANGGRYYPYHIAEWNGSAYVKVDYRAQIDAITEFTETYTEIVTKQVMVSLPSSNTGYVYIPSGTMQAEEGMTWQEWINSPYNTLGFTVTSVWNSDYEEIELDTPIVANQNYGFKNDEVSLTLNEYGFYFNQPYKGEMDGMIIEFIFYENCSVHCWGVDNGVYVMGEALPAGMCAYDEKTIVIEDAVLLMVSDDGKKLTHYDSDTELSLSPVKQSSLRFNSVYEYESGLGIAIGSDYSLTLFGDGEIFEQQPANSVVVENNMFDVYIGGDLVQFVIYPDGSRIGFGEVVLESTGLRLNTPVIQLQNDIVQIEPVLGATAYEIYVDNVLVGTTTANTFNVSGIVDTVKGSYVAVKAINTEMSAASKFAWQWRAGIEVEPGLYNSNNTLLASWGELVYDLHLDIEHNYSDVSNDSNNSLNRSSSAYSVLKKHFNGLTDLKLIIGFGSRIGAHAFNYCEITTIEIPNSIVDIDFTAFRWHYELEWIEIEENHPLYVSIDGIVYNKSLTEIVCVPNNISGTVELPDGITEIRDGEFAGCENITKIVIPNSVTRIGSGAFSGATRLLEIQISKYVTEIGNNPFTNASSLSSIVVDPDNPRYHSDGNCLIETNTKTLISGCRNSIIPADGTVTIIGKSAFYSVLKGTSIVLPNTIIRIESSAFERNYSLTSITLSKNLEYIGEWAFSNTQIYNFTIPASVKYISSNALTYRVKSVTFENPNGWYKANDEKGTGKVAININSLTPSQIQDSYLFHD